MLAERIEELDVQPALAGITEVAGVGVGHALSKTVLRLDRIELPDPALGRAVPEQGEEGVVLRHRVRQLHKVADEERPHAAAATRLGLVRVGVRYQS